MDEDGNAGGGWLPSVGLRDDLGLVFYEGGPAPTTAALLIGAALILLAAMFLVLRRPAWALVPLLLGPLVLALSDYQLFGIAQLILLVLAYVATLAVCIFCITMQRQGAPASAPPVAVTPPGWYPDPSGGPLMRYWDGTGWTLHTAPKA